MNITIWPGVLPFSVPGPIDIFAQCIEQSYTTPGLGYFDTTLVIIKTKLVYSDTRLVLKDPSLVRMYQNNIWGIFAWSQSHQNGV